MAGLSINLSFHPHVQSFVYALDREGIDIIRDSVYACGIANKDMTEKERWKLIQRYEIGMGRAMFQAGFSISSLIGPLGGFSIGPNDIDQIKLAVGEEKYTSWKHQLGLHSVANIWTDTSTPYGLPWGDDMWNPHALRMIGNGMMPHLRDLVFFKASRLYMISGMEDIGYDSEHQEDFLSIGEAVQQLPTPNNETDICELAKTDFRKAGNVFAIVTGMMHSGTSMLAQLIMSDQAAYGGVECGLMMAKEPSDFANVHPFFEWMIRDDAEGLWGLSTENRAELMNARCDAEMYNTLHRTSPLYHYGTNKNSHILDKTPGYIVRLVEVMDRTPGVPVVIAKKSALDMEQSLIKRYGDQPETMALVKDWLGIAEQQLELALKKYPDRVHITNTSRWYEEPNEVMKGTFDFLGLDWDPEYLSMNAVNNRRPPGSVFTVPFTTKKSEAISVVYESIEAEE